MGVGRILADPRGPDKLFVPVNRYDAASGDVLQWSGLEFLIRELDTEFRVTGSVHLFGKVILFLRCAHGKAFRVRGRV